jgi:hypothetical protein
MPEDQPVLEAIEIPNRALNRARKANERKKKQEEKEAERNKKATSKTQSKKQAKKSGDASGPLAFLKTTNYWLENVPIRIITAFENFIGNGEKAIQARVDIICTWLAWKVNIAIERKRQIVLKILYEQYQHTVAGKVMQAAMAVKSLVTNPLGAIGTFAGVLFGPFAAVISWVSELISEILKLAENLAKIVKALPPTPPNPHINYDKFKLKVGSISLATVTTDPSNLPPPEVLFPEPEKPFTKEAFMKGWTTASANLKSMKTMYKLNDEDKKTLEAMNKNNIDIGTALADSKDVIKGMLA